MNDKKAPVAGQKPRSAPAFGVLLGIRRTKAKTEVTEMQGCVSTRPRQVTK
jgi:hypothetical protein